VGIGGLGDGLLPLGFDATGGGTGLGLGATGGGFTPNELEGRELAGVLLDDPLADTTADFFQGTAEPFDGARPGKTATGLADASAANDFTDMIETVGFEAEEVGIGAAATASGAEGGGGGRGGGERAAGAALGFGGISSR